MSALSLADDGLLFVVIADVLSADLAELRDAFQRQR
jgi:hypothetical protein